MTNDMTVGSPLGVVVRMSVPILIGNLFQQFYAMADTIIVGRLLGSNALAAVGSTTTLYFLIFWFVADLVNGFAVIVAQRFGARDEDKLRKAVGHTVVLSAAITAGLAIVSCLSVRKMLVFMNTPTEILEDSYRYISVIFAGLLATVLYNMSAAVLRALGDARTPLCFLIFTSALNVILDILFIAGLRAGVAGAAYATVISQALSAILCIVYMYWKFPILHLKKTDFYINKSLAAELLKMGIPMGLMGSMTAVGVIILQFAINSFGTAAMAAYAAATKVEQFVCMPLAAYSVAMANFVGQNYGAGKYENIRKGIRQCMILMLMTAAVMCVVTISGGDFLAGLFLDSADSEVLAYASGYLDIMAFFLPLFGIICMFRRCLQGVGDSGIAMINGMVETGSRIIWMVVLTQLGTFGMVGWANASTWGIATVILYLLYRRKMKEKLADAS